MVSSAQRACSSWPGCTCQGSDLGQIGGDDSDGSSGSSSHNLGEKGGAPCEDNEP